MAESPERPPRTKGNLTVALADELRALIHGGKMQPGERLPTEQAMVRRFSVSRTVVREAVAALRADGLVEPRQGSGVFVLKPPAPRFGVAPLTDERAQLSDIIETIELRAAVEIEAAGLAATRSSPAQRARIQESSDRLGRLIESGDDAIDTDFEFHLRVADGTNNPRFSAFLGHLGRNAIPRLKAPNRLAQKQTYLRQIQQEHQTIVEAIELGSTDQAREAMRRHLKGSQSRYERLEKSARASDSADQSYDNVADDASSRACKTDEPS